MQTKKKRSFAEIHRQRFNKEYYDDLSRREELWRVIEKKFNQSPTLSKLPKQEQTRRMQVVFEETWPLYQIN